MWLGMIFGLLFPAFLFGILYGINLLTHVFENPLVNLTTQKLMFVSVALNIIYIRYYFIKEGFGKTGQGLLASTVFLIVMVILAYR